MNENEFNTGINIMIEALENSSFNNKKQFMLKRYLRELSQSYKFKNKISNPVEIDSVIKYISKYFNIPTKSLVGKARYKEFVKPRHILTFILIKHFCLNNKTIAYYTGRKERTTVYHSEKVINDFILNKKNPDIINTIYDIEKFMIKKNYISKPDRVISKPIFIADKEEKKINVLLDIKM